MKTLRTAISFAMILTTLAAVAEPNSQKSFDMLKALSGTWEGTNTQGKPVQVSYRLTGGGSALMSEILATEMDKQQDMISMFHMDGDRLLMTHYCGVGNQPRMRVMSADAKSVSFEFVDGTNIKPGDGHMQRVTFTQADATHHIEEWVFLDHGTEHKELFTLERAK